MYAQASKCAESLSTNHILLHPLVIVNITDHFTRLNFDRTRATLLDDKKPPVRSIGALFGEQGSRKIEIHTSFEVPYTTNAATGETELDWKYLQRKKEMYNQVFQGYDVVGWYTTGVGISDSDVKTIHEHVRESFHDTPLLLVMDTNPDKNVKNLPVYIFETELKSAEKGTGGEIMTLQRVTYVVESEESERIGVETAMHVDEAAQATQTLVPYANKLQNAVATLKSRANVVVEYVKAVKAGTVPPDYELLRQISSLCNALPCADSPQFSEAFHEDYDDALLITYLGVLTKGTCVLNGTVDKSSVFADRKRPGMGMSGFFS